MKPTCQTTLHPSRRTNDGGSNSVGVALLEELPSAVVGRRVEAYGLSSEARTALGEFLSSLSDAERVALLKAAVETLPSLRGTNRVGADTTGALYYEAAVLLYGGRLPLSEEDLCDLAPPPRPGSPRLRARG